MSIQASTATHWLQTLTLASQLTAMNTRERNPALEAATGLRRALEPVAARSSAAASLHACAMLARPWGPGATLRDRLGSRPEVVTPSDFLGAVVRRGLSASRGGPAAVAISGCAKIGGGGGGGI